MIETAEQRLQRLANNARLEAAHRATAEFEQWLRSESGFHSLSLDELVSDREYSLMRRAWDASRARMRP